MQICETRLGVFERNSPVLDLEIIGKSAEARRVLNPNHPNGQPMSQSVGAVFLYASLHALIHRVQSSIVKSYAARMQRAQRLETGETYKLGPNHNRLRSCPTDFLSVKPAI